MQTDLCISQTFPINYKCRNFVQIFVEGLCAASGMEICRFPSKLVEITKQHNTSNGAKFLVIARNQMLCTQCPLAMGVSEIETEVKNCVGL